MVHLITIIYVRCSIQYKFEGFFFFYEFKIKEKYTETDYIKYVDIIFMSQHIQKQMQN